MDPVELRKLLAQIPNLAEDGRCPGPDGQSYFATAETMVREGDLSRFQVICKGTSGNEN